MGPSHRQAGSVISQMPPLQAEALRLCWQIWSRVGLTLLVPSNTADQRECLPDVHHSPLQISDNQGLVDFKACQCLYQQYQEKELNVRTRVVKLKKNPFLYKMISTLLVVR